MFVVGVTNIEVGGRTLIRRSYNLTSIYFFITAQGIEIIYLLLARDYYKFNAPSCSQLSVVELSYRGRGVSSSTLPPPSVEAGG